MPKIKLDEMGRSFVLSIIALLVLLSFALGLYAYGIGRNIYLTKYSATAKGTTANFQKSKAQATIKDYFVDGNGDVLIAIIGLSEQVTSPMPYVASDYLVVTDSTKHKSDVPVLFGRMGTDGDLFLIIPKPDNEIYDIVVANRNYIDYSSETSKNNTQALDLDKKSITKIISETAVFVEKEETNEKKQKKSNESIRFRIGKNTALDDERYSPSRLDVPSLLIDNGDNSYNFDFKTFWELVYKQPLIDKATEEVATTTENLGNLRSTFNDLQKRLSENNKDQTALSELSKVQSSINSEEQELARLTDTLNQYQSLEFNEGDFDDYLNYMFAVKF